MSEGKIINHGFETQAEIIEGVKKSVEAIKKTLGPSGKAVCISGFTGPEVSRDGATVAKSISFKNQLQNTGAIFVKNAAAQTERLAGDGTSSTSLLIKEMCEKGQKALRTGANVNEVKSGMLKAGKWMAEYIKNNSIPVNDDMEKIRKVATISANNDPAIGNLVVECMEKVGMLGIITADFSSGLETTIDVTTGMKLDRGWASPQYVTNPTDGTCVMEDPYVIVVGERLSSVQQILPLMEQLVPTGRPFLFIVDDIDEVVNTTLVMNTLQGAIRCCVVKGIDFGDSRKNIMADISILTGGKYISPENGLSVTQATKEDLGVAKKVVISRDSCIIYEGGGDSKEIAERVEILSTKLTDPGISDYDKTKFAKRVANLSGGIAVVRAGGASETEKQNLKQTIEDSILASKSAIAEGCSLGSGYIYYKGSLEVKKDKTFWKSLVGDEVEGAEIVFSSLPVILKTIADNSGVSGEVVLEKVKSSKPGIGYNAKTRKYGNLLEEGILDSSKSLRVALKNSISAASMILLIDCTIIDDNISETKVEG